MNNRKHIELPWDIENTIQNLKTIKEFFQQHVIKLNLDGRGKKDAEEVAFDFDRAIEAIEKTKPVQITEIHIDEYRCPECGAENICNDGIVGHNYCPECGQRILQITEREG